ncbi:radical SAM/SPASM domain-containing protein [Velocimicrobium porci]|uniref:4Fe-4S cluster-binding domain-containing protein n=1 Tax=Velocimicrobium porci TaxID=2606634 RepID=A0A6L5Y0W5_9FIRM|nr:radical SAM protein [Velocimicrobium porci]MSS64755.1 4Fe-4S cluster-binding domain-containing protein [Velocimicrobium porci]
MLGVFWITTDCNMNCVYCYEGNNKKKFYMNRTIIKEAIDFLIDKMLEIDDEKLTIDFHGGEPFLAYDSICEIVENVKQKCHKIGINVRFGCTTNATLLNFLRLKFVVENFDDFTISMDGAKSTQNYSRPFKTGKETHAVVEKCLKETLKVIPNLRVRMTFNHLTVNDFYDNIKYFGDMGVKYVVPTRDFYDRDFGENEFIKLKQQLFLVNEYIENSNNKLHVSMLEKFPLKKLGKCSGGIDSFHIDPNGNIYPCALSVGNENFLIGNVNKGINIKKRDALLKYSVRDNASCLGCDLHDYCEQTRCKIVNKILAGAFCTPSAIACTENRMLYDISTNLKE